MLEWLATVLKQVSVKCCSYPTVYVAASREDSATTYVLSNLHYKNANAKFTSAQDVVPPHVRSFNFAQEQLLHTSDERLNGEKRTTVDVLVQSLVCRLIS